MYESLEKFKLNGRVAVVAGGAGLLGRQFSGALAQAGATVVVADLNPEAARQIAAKLCAAGGQARGVTVDVVDPASVRGMVEGCVADYGRLDVLVCSAAMDPKFDPNHMTMGHTGFEEFPLEMWSAALQVNLTGPFLCAQAAARPMLEQGSGTIINICSTYGLVGPDQRIYKRESQEAQQFKPAYYSVTKAGILGLTRYLATYYAGKGIRANALTPGGVFNGHDEEFVRNYSARTVLGRMARQDEMNGALLFLASDASSYMTGANLIVDGGWTAW